MNRKQENHGMHLQRTPRKPRAKRDIQPRPPIPKPIHHHTDERQRRRNRGTFKVLRLARLVLGKHGDRNIEPRQPRETAENENGENDVVERGAETDAECSGSGGKTERNLPFSH